MLTILKNQDWLLTIAVFSLVALGLLGLYSFSKEFFTQQLLWFGIAVLAALALMSVDLRPLARYRWFVLGIYGLSLFLLLITHFFAPVIRQAKSWIVIGPIQFQTSEFTKVALVILYAYFFAREHVGIARLSNILKSFLYVAIPAFLIFKQPDLGSAIILFSIWAGFLIVSGIPPRHLLIGFIIFVILGASGWNYLLADYQRDRLIGFLNPRYDPLGVNYSVIQSKIAIGSAGFWGKGFGQGTQTQLGFLPEAQSDFAFSAFIEEWGFLGGAVVLGVFLLLLIRIVFIGLASQNNFFRLICLGAVIVFLAQFLLNVGSALGFLPVTGVTFPFFSYGGSSLLINMGLVGLIQSIAVRQSILRES